MIDPIDADGEWTQVAGRLAGVRNYWLATTGPAGPHTTPVWGVVVDRALYLYSTRSSLKARNLARDPRATVHLESGDDVCIVHGHLFDRGDPLQHPRVVEALSAKYNRPGDGGYLPSGDPSFDVLYQLQPRRALMWSLDDFDGSQRRWAVGPGAKEGIHSAP